MTDRVRVEVCLALPGGTERREVECPVGTPYADAVAMSGLLDYAKAHGINIVAIGAYGKRILSTATVRAGDRIELYRALVADPKAARQRRVAHQRAQRPDRWVKR